MSLAKKVIIVTGAGSGIGRDTAILLGAENAKIGLFDINTSIFDVETQIKSLGGTALAIQVDVSSSTEVDAATKTIAETFGPIDGKSTRASVPSTPFIIRLIIFLRYRWCQPRCGIWNRHSKP